MRYARVNPTSQRSRLERRGQIRRPLAAILLLIVPGAVHAGDARFLPLRWCAIENTPAVTNPMGAPPSLVTGMPETNTNDVLWRRHERASNTIWIPGANISFRSAITAAIAQQASFPIIADPCPPTNVTLCQGGPSAGRQCTPDAMGGSPTCGAGNACATQACPAACTVGCPGQLGDVLIPDTAFCQGGALNGASCNPAMSNCGMGITCAQPAGHLAEYNLVVAGCTAAWDALATQFNTTLLGEIAVNIGVWRNSDGTRGALKGRAQGSTINGSPCNNPPTGVTSATGGAILGVDNQNFTFPGFNLPGEVAFEQTNERMIAHELGHTLFLWHGDGVDNDGDTFYDQVCDADENTCATPLTFMSSTACNALSATLTAGQRTTSRAVASVYTGVTQDPPGVLIPGPNVGDERTDTPVDAADQGIDIVRVTIQENQDVGRTSFSHALFGVINFSADPERQYVVFADLDGNPATGGAPSALGFATSFVGAELVTRVVVGFAGEFTFFDPTVWRFQGGSFVECTPASDPLCSEIGANVLNILGGDDGGSGGPPKVDAHVVTIEMPNAIRGAMGQQVRFQALAQQLSSTIPPANLQLDRVPDEPLDGAKILRPVAPDFPVCLVSPDPVAPGAMATVEAAGLFADSMAKTFLGDAMVGGGMTDAAGNVTLSFRVPIDARQGLNLMTVGVVGTALTADCVVEVLPGPPIILLPEVRANEIGEDHTVTALVRGPGGPQPGVLVTFGIGAGPNAGASGTCTPHADCTTSADGTVSFIYTDAGGRGVDQITASSQDGGMTNVSNTALKFWDENCNENTIADTCDVDCDGFTGLCQAVVGCGMSADANDDGFPDECHQQPDHYQCYESKPKFFAPRTISVQDQFGTLSVTVRFPHRLCNPVDKNGEGIIDPTEHLTGYKAKATTFTKVTNQVLVDQFGTLTLDLTRPTLLMLPTAKDGVPVVSPPVDHFMCYKVRPTKGKPKFAPRTVTVADQFQTATETLLKPAHLCAPANKNDENPDAPSHTDHLLCYKTKSAVSFGTEAHDIANQFGIDQLTIIHRRELCVPALKNPPPTTTTTTTTSSTTSTSTSTSSTTTTSTSTTSTTLFGSPSRAFTEPSGSLLE